MTVAGTAVGGPVVTPNEFRARIGLPPLEGGDELNKPLNNANNGETPHKYRRDPIRPATHHPMTIPTRRRRNLSRRRSGVGQ